MRCLSVAKSTSRLPNQQQHLRHSKAPTLNDCDQWLCGVWARGLSLDAIHMAGNLTSAPPFAPETMLIMKGRIDESISFDNEGPDFNIVMGGRERGKSMKLVYCCAAGITLRTPKANWRTDRARWWIVLGVRLWLKNVVQDAFLRGFG